MKKYLPVIVMVAALGGASSAFATFIHYNGPPEFSEEHNSHETRTATWTVWAKTGNPTSYPKEADIVWGGEIGKVDDDISGFDWEGWAE